MPELADDFSISSVHVRNLDTFGEFKDEVDVDQIIQPEVNQEKKYHPDAANQETLHSRLVPMFHIEEFKPCTKYDTIFPALMNLSNTSSNPLRSLHAAHLTSQTFLDPARGLQFPSFPLVTKSAYDQVGSTTTPTTAMPFNMLEVSWNLQQHYQQQQQQQQHQQLLYTQQQLQFSQTLSNLLLQSQHACPPPPPCSLLPFGSMPASAGRP